MGLSVTSCHVSVTGISPKSCACNVRQIPNLHLLAICTLIVKVRPHLPPFFFLFFLILWRLMLGQSCFISPGRCGVTTSAVHLAGFSFQWPHALPSCRLVWWAYSPSSRIHSKCLAQTSLYIFAGVCSVGAVADTRQRYSRCYQHSSLPFQCQSSLCVVPVWCGLFRRLCVGCTH